MATKGERPQATLNGSDTEDIGSGYRLLKDTTVQRVQSDVTEVNAFNHNINQFTCRGSPTYASSRSGITSDWVDVASTRFNLSVAIVILINAVVIGLETDFGESRYRIFEHLFTIAFLLEMCIKLDQLGVRRYTSSWRNPFDCLLVWVSVFDLYLIPLLFGKGVPQLRSLKLLRLFRILRIVRLFSIFSELALILDAFFKAFATVMWVSLLLFIIDYICAIFLTQSIGHNAAMWGDKQDDILTWFGHIGNSMRTLFIIMTLSDWDVIVLTLSSRYNALVVFTCAMFYILVTAYTMLSLITGCISEALITAQRKNEQFKDEEKEKANGRTAAEVLDLLRMIDADNNGSVTYKEVKGALQHPSNKIRVRLAALNLAMNLHDLLELVERLGAGDPDAGVTIEQVGDAISNMSGFAKSHTVWEIKHTIISKDLETNKKFNEVQKQVADLALQAVSFEAKLDLLMAKLAEGDVTPKASKGCAFLSAPPQRGADGALRRPR